jgi:hypothetical protein
MNKNKVTKIAELDLEVKQFSKIQDLREDTAANLDILYMIKSMVKAANLDILYMIKSMVKAANLDIPMIERMVTAANLDILYMIKSMVKAANLDILYMIKSMVKAANLDILYMIKSMVKAASLLGQPIEFRKISVVLVVGRAQTERLNLSVSPRCKCNNPPDRLSMRLLLMKHQLLS